MNTPQLLEPPKQHLLADGLRPPLIADAPRPPLLGPAMSEVEGPAHSDFAWAGLEPDEPAPPRFGWGLNE